MQGQHCAVGSTSDCRSSGHKLESHLGHIHVTFLEIDHEIISMVIHLLKLIEEGQLSVNGKRICTGTGLPLRGRTRPT